MQPEGTTLGIFLAMAVSAPGFARPQRFGARIGGGPDPRIGEKVCLQRLERGGDFLIECG